MKDDKKLYEVYVAERDLNKRLISRRKRGISSEREAKQIEFNFKTELKITAQQKPILTWASWKVEVIKRVKMKFKNATLQNYESYLKKWVPPSWDPLQITEIKSEDIYNAIELSGSGLSSISKHTFLKILKRIFQEAVESGHLLSNPAKGISVKVPESSKKVLTTSEVEILLRSAKDTNHRFYPIWCFAVKTGMRSGEMYALQWSDIDFERRLISVNKQWTKKDGTTQTKTGDNRLVPISNDLLSFLMELKNSTPDQPNVLPHLIEWTHGE
jgi:integrase